MKGNLTVDDIIAEKTAQREHLWVEIRVIPLSIKMSGVMGYTIAYEDAAFEHAAEDAVHGCFFCDEMLTRELIGTECSGPDEVMKETMESDDT